MGQQASAVPEGAPKGGGRPPDYGAQHGNWQKKGKLGKPSVYHGSMLSAPSGKGVPSGKGLPPPQAATGKGRMNSFPEHWGEMSPSYSHSFNGKGSPSASSFTGKGSPSASSMYGKSPNDGKNSFRGWGLGDVSFGADGHVSFGADGRLSVFAGGPVRIDSHFDDGSHSKAGRSSMPPPPPAQVMMKGGRSSSMPPPHAQDVMKGASDRLPPPPPSPRRSTFDHESNTVHATAAQAADRDEQMRRKLEARKVAVEAPACHSSAKPDLARASSAPLQAVEPQPTPQQSGSPPENSGSPEKSGSQKESRTRTKTAELRSISIEYPYNELHAATKGFDKASQLGMGAYGAVYRAEMRDGSETAVKVIDLEGLGPVEAELAGFEDEIAMLSKFRHPNLILLMGWGKQAARRYLIYEFMPGGDVQNKLLKCKPPSNKPFLARERLSVALDAATGLAYLHNATPHAYHRDIKSANILLTANGSVAKMADFGLSCVAKVTKSAASISGESFAPEESFSRKSVKSALSMVAARNGACGTPGYICPLYMQSGRITESAEMYSFGVVLLELLVNIYPCIVAPQAPGGLAYPMSDVLRLNDKDAAAAQQRAEARLDPTAHWPEDIAAEVAALGIRCMDTSDLHQARRPAFNDVCRAIRAMLSRTSMQELPPMPFGAENSAKFSQFSWNAGSMLKPTRSEGPEGHPSDLQADLVMDVVYSHAFPSGVPQALRTLRLQPIVEHGRCKVQVGRYGVAGGWFHDVLQGDAWKESSHPMFFEVAWLRTAGGAPNSPNLRVAGNALGSVSVNGAIIPAGGTVALKANERSQIKFLDDSGSTLGKGVPKLTLSIGFNVRLTVTNQRRPIPSGFELETTRGNKAAGNCCDRCCCVLQ